MTANFTVSFPAPPSDTRKPAISRYFARGFLPEITEVTARGALVALFAPAPGPGADEHPARTAAKRRTGARTFFRIIQPRRARCLREPAIRR